MSEKSAEYDVTPSEADAGALAPYTRIRMNFEIQAKGNCKPDVTVEIATDLDPDDDILRQIAVVNSKTLTMATILGRRFELVYAYYGAEGNRALLGDTTRMPDSEEIDGWLVERVPAAQ